MKLFSITGEKTVERVQSDPFKLEKDIQNLVEGNTKTLFDLEFLKSEMKVNNFFLDTLCYDRESNAFVIIEYKKLKNFSVIDQGYTYLSLMLNNKADFILEYNESMEGNLKRPNITITINKVHEAKTNFVTLIHEIAHLFLGHLGNYEHALWPSRSNLSKSSKEFEAESVAFVLAGRLNLETLSNQYLAGYMLDNDTIPSIDIRQIGKAVEWIEQMINGSTPKIFRTKKRGTA